MVAVAQATLEEAASDEFAASVAAAEKAILRAAEEGAGMAAVVGRLRQDFELDVLREALTQLLYDRRVELTADRHLHRR